MMIKQIIDIVRDYIQSKQFIYDEDNYPIGWNKKNWEEVNSLFYGILKKFDPPEIIPDSMLSDTIQDLKIRWGYWEYGCGAFCEKNEVYKEKVISNINYFTFNSYYGNIIRYLYQINMFKVSDDIIIPYSFIIKESDKINLLSSPEEWSIFKLYKNFFYGYLITSKKSISIESEGSENISFFSNWLMSELYSKIGQNMVYADTDSLYYIGDIKHPKYIMNNIFKNFDMPYQIKTLNSFICFGKKKYIEINDGDIKLRGFPIIKL